MNKVPNYSENVSLKLSEILSDIGINERIVLKRRRAMLLRESIHGMSFRLFVDGLKTLPIFNIISRIGIKEFVTAYILGSQSEGTTTLGLDSDTDMLMTLNIFNVIQDWSDWRPGYHNLLIIQDEDLSPGYCKLQILRGDVPLPYYGSPSPYTYTDRNGQQFLQNKCVMCNLRNVVKNGPALTTQGGKKIDIVNALPCATWPLQARQWLGQRSVGQWPSEEDRQYCYSTGCFVVSVGRKGSVNEKLEWRVSTSLAERCLMFSLNITQVRCYVLMKMIKKTFIEPNFQDVISSYMCKNVLFHCIENTQSSIWRENKLLECLTLCLEVLYTNVGEEKCPHFIIPSNNLMRGKIPHEGKPHLLERLRHIIESDGSLLHRITCDNLGPRLQLKFNKICPFTACGNISGSLLIDTSCNISYTSQLHELFTQQEPIKAFKQFILTLLSFECQNNPERIAQKLLVSQFGASLGSALASLSIQEHNIISAEAMSWISLCLNTDATSCKLKFASMLYCTGQYQRSELVLSTIEDNFNSNNVAPLCIDHGFNTHYLQSPGFNDLCDRHDEEAIQSAIANCVRFLPCEVHCVPKELKQEMYRSTNADRCFRGRDHWMDCAVVDSPTFLYFLQYKVYHNLSRRDKKHKALTNLAMTIEQEPNLGHRETALNLLGQCMEQERMLRHALQCYSLSLNVRKRNNAAKIHICRLLNNAFHA